MTPTATRDPRVDPYRVAIEQQIVSRLADRRWYRAVEVAALMPSVVEVADIAKPQKRHSAVALVKP